jgi:hypothetical protein
MPLVPWTAMNNSVVVGSLVLALALFYPVYRLAWLTFSRHQAHIAQKLQQYHVDKVLAGAEMAARLKTSRPS